MAFKIGKKYLWISFSIKIIKVFSIFSRMILTSLALLLQPDFLKSVSHGWKWMGLGKFSKHPILVPKQYLLFCDQHAKILHHISEVYQHFWDLNRHLIYAICNVLVPKNSKISAGNCQILESIIWNGSGAKILV